MRWRDHERIASAIASRFDLPKEELVKGCIEPDKESKRKEYHHGNLGELFNNLAEAEKYFRLGSRKKMAFNLGKALHYIHDSCIVSEMDGYRREKVESIENSISSIAIPKKQIENGFKDRQSNPVELVEKIAEVFSSRSVDARPKDIMHKATYYSALATASIHGLDVKLECKCEVLPAEYLIDFFGIKLIELESQRIDISNCPYHLLEAKKYLKKEGLTPPRVSELESMRGMCYFCLTKIPKSQKIYRNNPKLTQCPSCKQIIEIDELIEIE